MSSQTKDAGNYPSFSVGNQELVLCIILNATHHTMFMFIILSVILFSVIYQFLKLALNLKTKR